MAWGSSGIVACAVQKKVLRGLVLSKLPAYLSKRTKHQSYTKLKENCVVDECRSRRTKESLRRKGPAYIFGQK